MSEPFLIAHVVRGEPAFDIAERLRCPVCEPIMQGLGYGTASNTCKECEGEGFWWIIPTSGHRARPYWHWQLNDLWLKDNWGDIICRAIEAGEADEKLLEGWPDHYPVNTSRPAPASAQSGADLLEELGL